MAVSVLTLFSLLYQLKRGGGRDDAFGGDSAGFGDNRGGFGEGGGGNFGNSYAAVEDEDNWG